MKQSDILCHLMRKVRLSLVRVWCLSKSPGALACSCNPATWRQVLLDGLLWGFSVTISTCWSGVRTKACINMHLSGEPERSRLTKEWRKGPGGKPSSQKLPCGSVVGPRQRVAGGYLPHRNPDSELFIAICHIWTRPAELYLGWFELCQYTCNYFCEALSLNWSFGFDCYTTRKLSFESMKYLSRIIIVWLQSWNLFF